MRSRLFFWRKCRFGLAYDKSAYFRPERRKEKKNQGGELKMAMPFDWDAEKQFVMDIPIDSIISAEMGPLRTNGPHLEGICPFHNDKRRGSFKVTPGKNRWKCFACGEGGDKIDFISKLYGLNFEDSIHYISEKFGYVHPSGPNAFTSGKKGSKSGEAVRPYERKEEQQEKSKKASAEILDVVYGCMVKASAGMTQRLMKYLYTERHLKIWQMNDFFELPRNDDREFWRRFYGLLAERKIKKSVLLSVPGFYVADTVRGARYAIMDYGSEAYGILCRNAVGKIVGVQVGFFFHKGNGPKYLWLSSGNVEENHMGRYGCNSGAPYGIEQPVGHIYPVIVVTEGKYKALAFASKGMLTIDLHGVSNLRNLKNTIAELSKKYQERPSIMIGLDADAVVNDGVAAAVKNIYSFFKADYRVTVASWDLQLGKGFDDLVNNGNYRFLQKYPAKDFIEKYVDPLLKAAAIQKKQKRECIE